MAVDVTGWDTVVFTCRPPHQVFHDVLAAVLTRWPGALVEDLDKVVNDPRRGPTPAQSITIDGLPLEAGHLLFYRDTAMVRHMDEVAYAPMFDGDGPFSVIARVRREIRFRIARLEEVQVVGVSEFPPVEPYAAWFCSPLVSEITLITPDDPERQPFSAWACESVRQACGGPA